MHLKERYLYCRSLEFGNCVDFILWHCLFRSPQVLVLRVTLLSHLTSFLKTFLRFWGLLYEQFEASYSLSFSFNALLLVPCCWESLDFAILFVKLCSNPHIHWDEYHCRFIAGNIRTLTLFLGDSCSVCVGAIAVVTHLSSPHRRWRDERGVCFWICLWSLGSHLNWEDGSPQLTPTIPGHQCPEPEILDYIEPASIASASHSAVLSWLITTYTSWHSQDPKEVITGRFDMLRKPFGFGVLSWSLSHSYE